MHFEGAFSFSSPFLHLLEEEEEEDLGVEQSPLFPPAGSTKREFTESVLTDNKEREREDGGRIQSLLDCWTLDFK